MAGPEATNNVSAAGTLVPMLALGLPTTTTTTAVAAIMLVRVVRHPARAAAVRTRFGPGLDADRQPVHRQPYAARPQPAARPVWARPLRIPRPYLYAGILFFASMGAYAVNARPFDLFLLLLLGLLGFGMRRFGLPILPLIVGVILGPRAELQGRRALQLSGGS